MITSVEAVGKNIARINNTIDLELDTLVEQEDGGLTFYATYPEEMTETEVNEIVMEFITEALESIIHKESE